MSDLEKLGITVEAIQLQPTDLLILKVDTCISVETLERLSTELGDVLKRRGVQNPYVVLQPSLSMEVLHQSSNTVLDLIAHDIATKGVVYKTLKQVFR